MIIKVSLILEYCASGNLKTYLIDHNKDFIDGITLKNQQTNIDEVNEPNKHTLDLLMLWSYQVIYFPLIVYFDFNLR